MTNMWTQRVKDLLMNARRNVPFLSLTSDSRFLANQTDKCVVIYDLSQYFVPIFHLLVSSLLENPSVDHLHRVAIKMNEAIFRRLPYGESLSSRWLSYQRQAKDRLLSDSLLHSHHRLHTFYFSSYPQSVELERFDETIFLDSDLFVIVEISAAKLITFHVAIREQTLSSFFNW